MHERIPKIQLDPADVDPRLEAIHAAIEQAQLPGREGPYGLYDYTEYGDPEPHHVRDFREPGSATYGDCVLKTTDRDQAVDLCERLTREHVALAAMRATLRVLGLTPFRHLSAAATQEQRDAGRRSALYELGDMELCWVNTGDLIQHVMIPDPSDLGIVAKADRRTARTD